MAENHRMGSNPLVTRREMLSNQARTSSAERNRVSNVATRSAMPSL